MAHELRPLISAARNGRLPASRWAFLALALLAATSAAQTPPYHFQHYVGLPPGQVGVQQLGRGGPLPGYFQPVEILGPPGVQIALAETGQFGEPQKAPVRVGLLIGQVYRFAVFNIPFQTGFEVYPSIEVIDRLYAPPGQEARFPIRIDLTLEDLQLALDGKFVTRVIYLEDPERALPVPSAGAEQRWFEVPPGKDPLVTADLLGRPVAILRMGGRVPDRGPDGRFMFGCPPLVKYPPAAGSAAAPPAMPPVAPPAAPAPVAGSDGSLSYRWMGDVAANPSPALPSVAWQPAAVSTVVRLPSTIGENAAQPAAWAQPAPPATARYSAVDNEPKVKVLPPPPRSRASAALPATGGREVLR